MMGIRPIHAESDTRPRKLLFVIDSLGNGGAEHVLETITRELAARGDACTIFLSIGKSIAQKTSEAVNVTAPDFGPRSFFEKLVVNTLALAAWIPGLGAFGERRSLRSLIWAVHEGASSLSKQIATNRPDCVISFLPYSNLISCYSRLRFRWRSPLVCSDRSFLSHELGRLPCAALHQKLARLLYRQATWHIAVSRRAANDLHATIGVAASRILVIPNGVDVANVNDLALKSSEARRSAAFTIVAAGRLNRQKGFDILLTAVSMLPDRHWRLLILGEGEEEAGLLDLCKRLGIADKVSFLGWQSNPYPVIAAADVFALSSRSEGWPNALLEAIALGIAVVSTDCESGPSEILENGRSGLLVPVTDPAAMMQAISKLMNDPLLREELSNAARERANQFGIPDMIHRYSDAIDRSIASVVAR